MYVGPVKYQGFKNKRCLDTVPVKMTLLLTSCMDGRMRSRQILNLTSLV